MDENSEEYDSFIEKGQPCIFWVPLLSEMNCTSHFEMYPWLLFRELWSGLEVF